MKIEDIRRTIIIALVSEDELMNTLVLKGGNALALVHKVGTRSSLDLDFSIESDFQNPDEVRTKIQRSLEREFRIYGIEVFDFQWKAKPSRRHPSTPDWWGGYQVEFKLTSIVTPAYEQGIQNKRVTALTVDPSSQNRTFTIDISKHEYIVPKIAAELSHYTVFVYPLRMIAMEKLRAICQQMPKYPYMSQKLKRPRPRDFYDIHTICEADDVDLSRATDAAVLDLVFDAKRVDRTLLHNIKAHGTYQFHNEGWPAVMTSANPAHDFSYYFEFVCNMVSRHM